MDVSEESTIFEEPEKEADNEDDEDGDEHDNNEDYYDNYQLTEEEKGDGRDLQHREWRWIRRVLI